MNNCTKIEKVERKSKPKVCLCRDGISEAQSDRDCILPRRNALNRQPESDRAARQTAFRRPLPRRNLRGGTEAALPPAIRIPCNFGSGPSSAHAKRTLRPSGRQAASGTARRGQGIGHRSAGAKPGHGRTDRRRPARRSMRDSGENENFSTLLCISPKRCYICTLFRANGPDGHRARRTTKGRNGP